MPGRHDLTQRAESGLLSDALHGRPDAWGELARRHSRRVVVALLARGLALEEAEDLAQETWLVLIERQREGRLRELKLPGLAIAQAGWLAREYVRTRLRREALSARAVGGGLSLAAPRAAEIERRVEQREQLDAVRHVLDACAPRAREVFLSVYGPEPCSQGEAARRLGLSLQRVRQTLCEVRARMRAVLREREGECGA